MPITTELQNMRELKQVGFSDPQAEKLAELFERSQSQGFEKFSEILDRKLGEMESRLELKLGGRIDGLRAELYKALHDQLIKIFALVVGVVSLAVAIIKLFPNWYGPIGP